MTVSPKGGIGKSFVAALLTQWLKDRGATSLVAYDNDPANATLKAYEALEVRKLDLLSGRRADRMASLPKEYGNGLRPLCSGNSDPFVSEALPATQGQSKKTVAAGRPPLEPSWGVRYNNRDGARGRIG